MINWQPTQLVGRNVNYGLQSSALVGEWMACEKTRMTWLFAETIFNVKIAGAVLWVPIFATEKTWMVESISVCMLTNWRYSCPTAIYGKSCYYLEKTSALIEGHHFRELWVTKKYAVALCRKPKSRRGKKFARIRMCRKRLNLASMHLQTYSSLTAQIYQSHTDLRLFKAWRLCAGKMTTFGWDLRSKPFQSQTSSELRT